MEIQVVALEYQIVQDLNELPEQDAALLVRAVEAAEAAHAPYSGFCVGAALLLENGQIITGNNQENPAYPSGLCAERVALFYASAKFPGVAVKTIAITAKSRLGIINRPIPPCGACRQVMSDSENRNGTEMRVIMRGNNGPVMICSGMKMLLPFSFVDDYLPK
jgi:cytidine deaminase